MAVAREISENFSEAVGFNADRTANAFGLGVIIAMAANIGDEDVIVETGSKFIDGDTLDSCRAANSP